MTIFDYIKALMGTGCVGFFIYHLNEYLKLKRSKNIKQAYDHVEAEKEEIRADIAKKSIRELVDSSHELADKVRTRR